MAYACLTIELITEMTQGSPGAGEPEVCSWRASVPGDNPVELELRAKPGSKLAEAVATHPVGGRLLISGFLSAIDLGEKGEDGQRPAIALCVVCPATTEQHLNEVTLVGHVGGEARVAEKSAKVSLALNRYRKNPEDPDGDLIEETDWIGVRGFGFVKGKIEKLSKGGLLEVAGSLSQMTNAKKQPYFEVRARSIRSHGKGKGGKSASVAPKSTSSVGYSAEEFEEAEGVGAGWD